MVSNAVQTAKRLNADVVADIKSGKKWTYTNKLKIADTFDQAEKKPLRRTNCARGVIWALIEADVLSGFVGGFYGKRGGDVVFKTKAVKEEMLNHYIIVPVKGKKTVSQCLKDGTIKPGDIVTYYSMNHTNMYLGDNEWFDTGHAYCNGPGENAVFKKWVGNTVYGTQKVGSVLRPKKITVYRVQLGAFERKANADRQVRIIGDKGFKSVVECDEKFYRVLLEKTYRTMQEAQAQINLLKKRGVNAIINERSL